MRNKSKRVLAVMMAMLVATSGVAATATTALTSVSAAATGDESVTTAFVLTQSETSVEYNATSKVSALTDLITGQAYTYAAGNYDSAVNPSTDSEHATKANTAISSALTITVTDPNGDVVSNTSDTALVAGTYTIAYKGTANTAAVYGTSTFKVKVTQATLAKEAVIKTDENKEATFEYNFGEGVLPGATEAAADQAVLEAAGVDSDTAEKMAGVTTTTDKAYTITYSNNTAVGRAYATVTITGGGNYTGTSKVYYNVVAKDVSKDCAVATDEKAYTYTGDAVTPKVVSVGVTHDDTQTTLTANKDYTIAYSDNTAVGTATGTVTFTGNYTGTKTFTYEIVAADKTLDSVLATAVETEGAAAVVYDGTAKTTSITLTDKDGHTGTIAVGGKEVTIDGVTYTVEYQNNTAAGTATATITADGYAGSKTVTFTINPNTTAPSVSQTDVKKEYLFGNAVTLTNEEIFGNKTLTEGTDYTVSYSKNTDAGTATATISFIGNYAGAKSATKTFTINQFNLSGVTVKAADGTSDKITKTYTGETIEVASSDIQLTVKKDINGDGNDETVTIPTSAYTVSTTQKDAGTGKTISIEAEDTTNFTGTATANILEVAKAKLSDVVFTCDVNVTDVTGKDQTNTENAIKAALTATLNGVDLQEDDISVTNVEYSTTTAGSTAKLTVAAGTNNNLEGDARTVTATIKNDVTKQLTVAQDLSKSVAQGQYFVDDISNLVYNGSAQTPKLNVAKATDATATLTEGKDYKLVYTKDNKVVEAPTDAGTYCVSVVGIGNYAGTVAESDTEFDFTIHAKSIEGATVTVADQTIGSTLTEKDIVVKDGSTTLTYGETKDYTFATAQVSGNTYKVTVTGKNNYTGTVEVTYTQKTDISGYDLVEPATKPEAKVVDGKATLTDAEIASYAVKSGTYTLTQGTDYTVTVGDIDEETNTVTLTFTGIGSYTGTLTAKVDVALISIENATATGKRIAYGADAKITVVLDGTTLTEGTDYTVDVVTTNPGLTTATITGIGKYTGTTTASFIVNPNKGTGLKATLTKSGKVQLTWSKKKGADGYVVYEGSKRIAYIKKDRFGTGANANKLTYTFKASKGKHTYTVRAYVSVDSVKYGGQLSTAKSITVK